MQQSTPADRAMRGTASDNDRPSAWLERMMRFTDSRVRIYPLSLRAGDAGWDVGVFHVRLFGDGMCGNRDVGR
jgi:hypothetical protein